MSRASALITGGAGQLGQDLLRECHRREIEVRSLNRMELDVTDRDLTARRVGEIRPDVIFNCAAFHQLDRCEERPDLAREVNVDGVRNLRDAADTTGARLVHVSTNYVFSGDRPLEQGGYTECDLPDPIQEYGRSKLAGEPEVGDDGLTVRTAGLYGSAGAVSKGGSFVDRMLARDDTIRMVADQHVNPTSTADLARTMVDCWLEEMTGVVHLVNRGGCSWFEFTREILRLGDHPNELVPVETDPDATPRRPRNGLLQSARQVPAMRPWQEALEEHIARR